MRAIHFLQIDWTMTKRQNRILWLLIIIALLLSVMQGNPYWGPLYMVFGSMILSTIPFCIRQKSSNGFLLMLPATKTDRVVGRFGYGLVLLAVSLLLGSVDVLIVSVMRHMDISYMLPFYAGLTAAGLIMLSLQYTILYIVGELKSQQAMGIIRMIPGFLLFFGGSWIVDFIEEHSIEGQTGLDLNFDWLIWICNHLAVCSLFALLAGIVIFTAGILVSIQVMKKRDFA